MNYNIRKADSKDINEIILLCKEHSEFEKAEYSSGGKAEKLSDLLFSENPQIFCLIVENETGILGYATYMLEFSTWEASQYIHMDCLYLRPQARNLGIGKQIIKLITQDAEKYNCEQIQWQTPEFNERSIRFYHRIGATSKRKLRMYFDPSKSPLLESII